MVPPAVGECERKVEVGPAGADGDALDGPRRLLPATRQPSGVQLGRRGMGRSPWPLYRYS